MVAAWLRRLLGTIRSNEPAFAVLSAIVLGVLGGYGAIAFREVIRLVHLGFFASDSYTLDLLASLPWWRRLLQPALGGLLVGLIVWRLAPEVRGSGIPEVMEAVARRGGAIRPRVVLAKAVAAALTIGSGGSAGREGPIVHVGSALGSSLGQWLHLDPGRLRTFVACGAAAGIAATFNAPIAGALFAMEVVLGDLTVARLSPIVISSVVATVISRHHLGDFPAFAVRPYELVSSRELVLYAGLGVLAGFLGVLFTRILYGTTELFEASPLPPWIRPALGGTGVGLLALAWPHVYGVGYETINATLTAGLPAALLLALVGAKLLATALTLGSGGSGGVFAPSLFLGASLGGAWGTLVHQSFPTITAGPGAYALVGMGAVVAATTHAPITAILIIFELTNDYRIIPPLMLACVIGVLLSGLLHRESVYTEKLARRGIKLREGRDVNLLRSLKVQEVMDTSPPMVPASTPLPEVIRRLLLDRNHELLVIAEDGTLVGTISLDEISSVLPEAEEIGFLVRAADAANSAVPILLPTDTLDVAMHLFGRSHREELPVCAHPRTREVLGTITRDAVIDAYNRRLFQADLAGGFASLLEAVEASRHVELLGGFVLTEIEVPPHLQGQSLAQARLRPRYNVEVLLVHHPEGEGPSLEGRPGELPTAGTVLRPGDRLLVLARPEDIERLCRAEDLD